MRRKKLSTIEIRHKLEEKQGGCVKTPPGEMFKKLDEKRKKDIMTSVMLFDQEFKEITNTHIPEVTSIVSAYLCNQTCYYIMGVSVSFCSLNPNNNISAENRVMEISDSLFKGDFFVAYQKNEYALCEEMPDPFGLTYRSENCAYVYVLADQQRSIDDFTIHAYLDVWQTNLVSHTPPLLAPLYIQVENPPSPSKPKIMLLKGILLPEDSPGEIIEKPPRKCSIM